MTIASTAAPEHATFTSAGSGASTRAESAAAAREAVAAARAGLDDATPVFGFLFAGPKHDLSELVAAATAEA